MPRFAAAVALAVLAEIGHSMPTSPLGLQMGVSTRHDHSFEAFEHKHNRQYATESERSVRRSIFEARVRDIEAHNAQLGTYKRAVNHFADRHTHELPKGLNKPLLFQSRRALPTPNFIAHADPHNLLQGLPTDVDWRRENKVTPVKDQGDCGSCWSFASTETVESHWAIKTGNLIELSEQFILDCVPNPNQCGGTGGCDGGTGELAYDKLRALGGIPSEWTYPYVSGGGNASTCHGAPLPPGGPHTGAVGAAANVTGHVSIDTNDYAKVMYALANIGPLAISVATDGWDDYQSGIFDGGNQTYPDLDHMVQLVGYGKDKQTGKNYWLVRNSWTSLWGEDGYIRLARPADGEPASCGLDITPLDGNGCIGGAPNVTVCGQGGLLFDAVYPLVL